MDKKADHPKTAKKCGKRKCKSTLQVFSEIKRGDAVTTRYKCPRCASVEVVTVEDGKE